MNDITNPISNLVHHIQSTYIDALMVGMEKEFELRCEGVKADDWKVVFSRLEIEDAWMNGFMTALTIADGHIHTNDNSEWYGLAERMVNNLNKMISE